MTSIKQITTRLSFLMLILPLVVGALVQPSYHVADDPATPTPTCPPGQFYNPVMQRCWPIHVDCPAGKIDVHGDASVCEPLDLIPAPAVCVPSPIAGALPTSGEVGCGLPWSLGGRAVRLAASVGCLDVHRQPYPRAMVNLPIELQVARIIPPALLAGVSFGGPGSYRLSPSETWTTEGLYLHEVYGPGATDSQGRPAFNTRALLAGDPNPYPSTNNVRARLVFRLSTYPAQIVWTSSNYARNTKSWTGGLSSAVGYGYKRSSFPVPGLEAQYSPFGPDANGANDLPAFKLSLSTQWRLYLQSEWDNYYVTSSHQYALGSHTRVEFPTGGFFNSYRVWDIQQAPVPQIYCNATFGYLPVPVIEGQAVLTP